MQSIVKNDAQAGEDGDMLTRLAMQLTSRIPELCVLKTFYDGRENVPTMLVPNATQQQYALYQRFSKVSALNLARAIADAVSVRQRPTGFRMISDKTMRSHEADDMWALNRMNLKARQMFHDVAVYGAAYALITDTPYPSYISILSPWNTVVSADEDSALVYAYDSTKAKELLCLYRLIRDEQGKPVKVYSHVASRPASQRTLPQETDNTTVYALGNHHENMSAPSFSSNFTWDSEPSEQGLTHALACGTLPVVRMDSPDGMGQFEPHLSVLKSIEQQRFERFTITEMQAFRQRGISGDVPTVYSDADPQVVAGEKTAGDPIDYSTIFQSGPDALWLMPKDTKLWESGITDIRPMVDAASTDIKHLAGVSGTPLDILSPDVAGSASGADLKREGLIFKVEDLNERADDAFVRMMRLALVASGNEAAADDRFETTWRPIVPPNKLAQAQAANFSRGVLPAKTNMRLNYGMTEIELAEAMQDLTDTQFQTLLAHETQLISGKLTSQQQQAAPFGLHDYAQDASPIEPQPVEATVEEQQ